MNYLWAWGKSGTEPTEALVVVFRIRSVQQVCRILFAVWVAVAATGARADCAVESIFRGGFDTTGAGLSIDSMLGGLAAATVELRSGDSVLASTDASDGVFSLSLPVVPAGAMLELRAHGLAANGQDFVELASYIGRSGHLFDLAGADARLRVTDLPEIALTPRGTARYAMAKLAAPGDPVDDECEYAARSAALAEVDVVRRAAVLQIDVANGGFSSVPRPQGQAGTPTTTLDLLLDPAAFDSEVQSLEAANPGGIAALEGVLEEPFCSRFAGDALLLPEERANGTTMDAAGAEMFRPSSLSVGTDVNEYGKDSYTWNCTGSTMTAAFAGQRVSIDYPIRIVNGEPRQVYAEYRTYSDVLQPIEQREQYTVVAKRSVFHVTFPFEPTLPAENSIGEGRMVILRAPQAAPFTAASLPGEYLLPIATVQANGIDAPGVHRVNLLADGAGNDLDDAAAVTWSIDAGQLMLSLPDRHARLIPVRDEAPNVADVFAIVEFSDGRAFVTQSLVPRKAVTTFWASAADVPAHYLQVDGRMHGGQTYTWWLGAGAGQYAESYLHIGGTVYASLDYHWSYAGPNQVIKRKCFSSSGSVISILNREPVAGECTTYIRREWMLYTASDNVLYMLEDMRYWYEDPALGHPPSSTTRRAYFYGRTPL